MTVPRKYDIVEAVYINERVSIFYEKKSYHIS